MFFGPWDELGSVIGTSVRGYAAFFFTAAHNFRV